MPYDHKNTTPDGFSSHQMKSLLEEVNRHHCQKRCMIGSGGGSVGLVVLILKTMTIEKHSISLRRIFSHICRQITSRLTKTMALESESRIQL